MKKLEYSKENLRLLAFIISKATSGSQFTKLLKDSGWTPECTASEEWQLAKKSKEEYLFDEFVKIGEQGRFDILDYVTEKTIKKDAIYFKISEKEYKFPRQPFANLKKKLHIVKAPRRTTNIPMFNERKFHKSVVFSAKKLFGDGHYSQSIFEACKSLNKRVQKLSGLEKDGKSLMGKVFNLSNPKIKLNKLRNLSDKDEQEGFMHIFMGVMQGIRNPKGHELINLRDKHKALEYLSVLSLLFRRLDNTCK
ncbi:MAG: TIGR02391 family protein [Patescibacteria group bacterium]|nr:TIGR02391 family protein [Patescibacteria group bacterium]